ncbi:hypothetical protein RCO28_36285 [Streptomyces sp. LHD-70]|uniref:hypothetical protein n=1 Tax=Streptomyces sp. LHD-70 TaxID=3072140 RepID=UPI00280FC9C9|nr:hypothetical protein [Streptomyces sp. LHD-70]MDQ8707889.1 hypothetical protein [Streptomyces sp. LHD-70]
MGNIDIGATLFFILGWIFALNVKGAADRVHGLASRYIPVVGTAFALRAMGVIWILVGGAFIALGLTD